MDWWWNDCFLVRSHLWAAIQKHAGEWGDAILDFGCGGKPYEQLFRGKHYVGVDIAVSGHDHATSQVDVFYNGHTLDIPDESFDAVISTEVLEHLFNCDEALSEIKRVLRPNGKLFITTPFLWAEHEKPYDYARYTTFGLKALLEKHGFDQVSVERRGHAVEGLCQLALTYAVRRLTVRPLFLHRLITFFWCSIFNLCAIAGRNILPAYPDIYLSNIATAIRPADMYHRPL